MIMKALERYILREFSNPKILIPLMSGNVFEDVKSTIKQYFYF